MMSKSKMMALVDVQAPRYIPTKLMTTKKGLQQEVEAMRRRVKELEGAPSREVTFPHEYIVGAVRIDAGHYRMTRIDNPETDFQF